MDTTVRIIDNISTENYKLKEAAEVIKNGGIVAFPTETVYGLGADAFNEEAVGKIFKAKGRPQDNPLIVHVANKDIRPYVKEIPIVAQKLIEEFWPGPMTIILMKDDSIPNVTSANLESIGIRMPDNEIALKFIEYSKTAIAAPSANISGRPSPTDYERCVEDLNGRVDYILGGSESKIGLESTIIDCTVDPPVVLRPGGITLEMIKNIVPEIYIDPAIMKKNSGNFKPKAPGMKYKHYAPNAEVTIIDGKIENTIEKIRHLAHYNIRNNKKVCILTTDESKDRYDEGIIISLGKISDLNTVAKNLFEILRKCDDLCADIILSESFQRKGIGIAIMNRLDKAAGFNIIEV